jgi:hypothetical protein
MDFQLVRPSALARTVEWSKSINTTYDIGELVEADGDGTGIGFDKADATSTNHVGVVQQTIAATDSDYASTTRLALLVDEHGEWYAEVGTGTADANDEGNLADLDADGEVDVTASSVDVFLIRSVDTTNNYVYGYITKWGYLF